MIELTVNFGLLLYLETGVLIDCSYETFQIDQATVFTISPFP